MAGSSKKKSKIKLTKQQKREILKCTQDPIYFIENYAKVIHPVRGVVPFQLYDFQKRLIKNYTEHRNNIILKPRQMGVSTTTAGFSLWFILFHKYKLVVTLATKLSVAQNLMNIVKVMYDELPSWLQEACPKVSDNQTSLLLSNGSRIVSSTSASDAGRSQAISLLVMDEVAFIDNIDTIWTSIRPTLSTGGGIIALSTPNGEGNWFHTKWVRAEEGVGTFNPILINWEEHPERDQAWFERETADMSPSEIAQEYLCSFLESGSTFLSPTVIKKIEREWIIDPLYKTDERKGKWIWKYPQIGHEYVIGVDGSTGEGDDFQGIQVLDVTEGEQVLEFYDKVSIITLPSILIDIGKEYNNALIIIETNSVGFGLLKELEKLGYYNIFYTDKSKNLIDQVEIVNGLYAMGSNKYKVGLHTNEMTRPILLQNFEKFISLGRVKVYSSRLLKEFKTFVRGDKRPEATKGNHDDLIFALVMALWGYFRLKEYSEGGISGVKGLLQGVSSQTKTTKGMYSLKNKNVIKEQSANYRQYQWLLDDKPTEKSSENKQKDKKWVLSIY